MVQALEQALQSPSTRVHALGCSQVDKMAERVTTGPENETGPDYETLFPFVGTHNSKKEIILLGSCDLNVEPNIHFFFLFILSTNQMCSSSCCKG